MTLLFLDNYHSLVDSVHHQTDDVGSGHARKLLCDDVFQINKIAHIFKCPTKQSIVRQREKVLLVISNHNEVNESELLLAFDLYVPIARSKSSLQITGMSIARQIYLLDLPFFDFFNWRLRRGLRKDFSVPICL